ncbi:uncharacterized protein LOC114260431 isoform X2 [Camellia sinensis]|uniref:uncharacterized protein LOC114260431 isoform X2 n=1 Tax=Camellia sinensis TaxID=4442 RepID=UPI001035DFB9|nr:uncharacterized protein LOC114260431 isoform X2 [Camellia sinensis]
MATDQRASPFPLLLLLLSLLIDVVAALASRRRWPFQRCFSSHRCCFSLSGLCFLIHCENNDSLHSSCWPYWSLFWIYEKEITSFPLLALFSLACSLLLVWNSYILWSFARCFSTVIVLWRRDYCMIPLSWMSILKDKDVHAFFSLLLPATINLAFVHIASFTDLCFSSLILGATAGLSYRESAAHCHF